MKLLFLGNSSDTGSWIDESSRRVSIMRERFKADLGIDAEIVAKNCWPNERMLSFVQRWVDEFEPDFVFLNIASYSFTYESSPLKVRRILGKVGEPVGDAGMRLAQSKRWSHNAAFRTLRRIGQASFGGDTHVSPEDAAARYTEVIRNILRKEGVVLAVKGPTGRRNPGLTRRQARRHEARRQLVHERIRQLTAQLRVPYLGSDEPRWKTNPVPRHSTVGDGLHANEAGHLIMVDESYPIIRDTWAAHLAMMDPTAVSANK
ncbi:MAG: SGNH/GDSL hydrolase family protein [Tepidiformaceae bacterium]